jgi:hypothetical protein
MGFLGDHEDCNLRCDRAIHVRVIADVSITAIRGMLRFYLSLLTNPLPKQQTTIPKPEWLKPKGKF